MEGEDEEERLWLVEEIMRRTLRREVEIRGVEERKGEGGRWVLIMELEKKEDVLKKGEKIGKLWRVGVDEDLTRDGERRRRWRMVETARKKGAKEKRVKVSNRELRVEGGSGTKRGGARKKMKRSEER